MIKVTVDVDGIIFNFRCVEEGFEMDHGRKVVHDDENDVLITSPISYLKIKALTIE